MLNVLAIALLLSAPAGAPGQPAASPAAQGPSWGVCLSCHERLTPGVVDDWSASRHSRVGVGCDTCHGSEHTTAEDAKKAKLPTPDTCARCHPGQVEEFKKGKHSMAWAAMKAMPTFHMQPGALMEGQKGCGGCHNLGIKTEAEVRDLVQATNGHGNASCDACHTRHVFSKKEAQQPQACQTCHMGFDHPQWEMFSASKHGVRHGLKQSGILPASVSAPSCQDCHMQEGDHEVRTAWGFLGLHLPLSEDPKWKADQVTILQALNVLDLDGKPTPRLAALQKVDVARLTQKEFDDERAKMARACAKCHAPEYVQTQLVKAEEMIRAADFLMAEAIREVGTLYRDGVIAKPQGAAFPFPDLLTFHDAATVVEQKLFVMFLEHRMRAFQGAFHSNPDYALWYGWSEMVRDLSEIRALGREMRVLEKLEASAGAKAGAKAEAHGGAKAETRGGAKAKPAARKK